MRDACFNQDCHLGAAIKKKRYTTRNPTKSRGQKPHPTVPSPAKPRGMALLLATPAAKCYCFLWRALVHYGAILQPYREAAGVEPVQDAQCLIDRQCGRGGGGGSCFNANETANDGIIVDEVWGLPQGGIEYRSSSTFVAYKYLNNIK